MTFSGADTASPAVNPPVLANPEYISYFVFLKNPAYEFVRV